MASVNTASIREEITYVILQLDEQARSGKVADETRMLISTLLMIVDMLVTIFFEESTKKGNKNSCIPSSQTYEDNSYKARKPKTSQTSMKSHLPTCADIIRTGIDVLKTQLSQLDDRKTY